MQKGTAMKVLVINAGSSSCKYQLLEMDDRRVLCSGLAERIGQGGGRLTHKIAPDTDKEEKLIREAEFKTHVDAMKLVIALLTDAQKGVIKDKSEIYAIGHRVLHGGEAVSQPVRVDDRIKGIIRECFPLGPLHNPANLMGIEVAEELFPGVPNVAVFDTEFGMGMPQEAYMYALPYKLYEELKIRRYGFHGTSHKYIAHKTAEYLGKPLGELRSITMHLGNGSSMSCVKNGKCFDTSMGLTPLEGLVMGTRSGDIDPAIVFHLHDALGMSVDDINKLLTKESGLLGLTEVTSDCRYVEDNYATKEDAKRAMDVYCHRLAKYIGSYTALMEGRLDAVVFTGGIGENAAMVRELSLGKLGVLGFEVDHERNLAARFGKSGFINKEGTTLAMVIPTNEELVIAQDACRLTA